MHEQRPSIPVSVPLIGEQRLIPVRNDETRILTCFLEYEPEAVLVHDILHGAHVGMDGKLGAATIES
jgi:hypothetical protein